MKALFFFVALTVVIESAEIGQRRVGMPAPAVVYSLTVRNQLPDTAHIEVTYRRIGGELSVESADIGAGQSKFFDSKTYAEGSARFMYLIESVRAVGTDGSEIAATAPWHVLSPTNNYVLVLGRNGGKLTLEHAPKVEEF